MRDKIDFDRAGLSGLVGGFARRRAAAMREQIIKRLAAFAGLQAVDDGVAAVVANDDNQFAPGHDRRQNIGIHHQIRSVADKNENRARGICHFRAPTARDFVAHARIAELAIEIADGARAPVFAQFARESARRRQRQIARFARAIDRAHDLRVTGQFFRAFGIAPAVRVDDAVPFAVKRARRFAPRRRRAPISQSSRQFAQTLARVGDQRERLMLAGVEAGGVQGDEAKIVARAENAPRSGREILQACADRQRDIALRRQRVGGRRADDAQRPDILRIVVQQRGATGDGFRHRQAVLMREPRHLFASERIMHAAAANDKRALRLPQGVRRRRERIAVGARAQNAMHPRAQKRQRAIERFGLRVLRQRQHGRAAIRRIEHRRHGLRQRRKQLMGIHNAIPITSDGAESVVDGRARIAEIFHLLQHRIGQAINKSVADQKQNRQAVGMGERGGGDHIRGAGADRTRGDENLPPSFRFGESRRGEPHPLLVLAAPSRQLIARGLQRLAQASHIAMPENGESAGEKRRRRAAVIGFDLLRDEIFDQRLRGRESFGFHCHFAEGAAARI